MLSAWACEDGFGLGQLEVDANINTNFQLVNQNSEADSRLVDIAFTHTMGIRPYASGLQSCSDSAEIVALSLE